MALLLQIFGAAFLLLILFLVVGLLVLRWKLRSFARELKHSLESFAEAAAASQTPSRLHLQRLATSAWMDEEEAGELSEQLRDLGFEHVGFYQTEEVAGLSLESWVQREARAWAVVYEHPQAGVWLDLVSQYDDGRRITFANTLQGEGVDQSPGHEVIRIANLDARELYARFIDERPVGPLTELHAEDFQRQFEKVYADEMDWRNSRGGATAEEIRRIAELGRVLRRGTLQAIEDQTREHAFQELDKAILERFLKESNSASEWEDARDSAFVVHDGLDTASLIARVEDYLDTTGLDDHDGGSRARFARFNAAKPSEERCRKLGSVEAPVAADIYAAPE
ncbi:MAG: hypothetical protein U0794_13045 [Isosphaeraceae bacterium]